MATVLILGATSDIGIAIAKKFASNKFDIQLAARKPEQLKPLESDIRIRYNVNCDSLAFDALKYESHSGFFNLLHPKPDVSICVFGVLYDEEEAFDDWQLTEGMIQYQLHGGGFYFEYHRKILHLTKKGHNHRHQFSGGRPRASQQTGVRKCKGCVYHLSGRFKK